MDSRASWAAFSAAPHRLFFWAGVLYSLAAVTLWSVQQASLYTHLLAPFGFTLPGPGAHGFMMAYGVLGFYIFGFLLTTFPRWLDGQPLPRAEYLSVWVLLNLGAHGFWLGLLLDARVALAGCLLMAAAYLLALRACLRVLLRAKAERSQQVYICLGLLMGALGILLMALGIAQTAPGIAQTAPGIALAELGSSAGAAWAFRASRWVGLYAFLLQVILPVLHRMLPFFTRMVTPGLEPGGSSEHAAATLPLLCAALWARALLGALPLGVAGEAQAWGWVADLALLIVLGREALHWRFWRAHMPPLLLILYLALGWMLLAFALGAGEGLYLALSGSAGPPPFRNAALHALTVGGLGSLLLGISTRVSLGHSGRGLATDRLLAALFWGFQAVPAARVLPAVLGAWWPTLAVHGFWSGLGWVAVFGLWFARIGPVLTRPRSDGRPG